jgi:hypothetical protein
VAQAVLQSFTYSVSLALTLSFGTSLLTIAALGGSLAKKNKTKLTRLGRQRLLNTYISLLKREPRLLLLACVDLMKLVLGVMSLRCAPYLTLWFFVIIADG